MTLIYIYHQCHLFIRQLKVIINHMKHLYKKLTGTLKLKNKPNVMICRMHNKWN